MYCRMIITESLQHAAEEITRTLDAEGFAVAMTAGEATAYVCHGGFADGTLITPTTYFYAASLTKQLIGALVAIAIERGLLSYETGVTELLADLPSWMADIRVRHLLHHTAGLPELAETAQDWPEDNAAALRALCASHHAVIIPGTQHVYSNAGYILLTEVLTAAFSHPVADLAQEFLFAPLGMHKSRLGGGGPHLSGYPDPPGTIGDGGWWTTIVDLQTWLSALNTHRLPYALERIEAPGYLNDGTTLGYAWGLGVAEIDGRRTVFHGGG